MGRDERQISNLIRQSEIKNNKLRRMIADSKAKVFQKIVNSQKKSSSFFNIIVKPVLLFSVLAVVAFSGIFIFNSRNIQHQVGKFDKDILELEYDLSSLDSYINDLDKEIMELDLLI